MKIITSHERTDMDALASIYAASLLYPDHTAVLPLKLNRNLCDFLALYRNELPFVERKTLLKRHISDLILVDTQAISAFRGMSASTRIHIIDHHPIEGDLPPHMIFEGSPIGATTSLLTERIREQGIAVSPLGASLMLLGIYEDTGSLAYLTTTPRDAAAAAWLMAQGAKLSVVNDFLNRPLTPRQRQALEGLVNSTHVHTILDRTVAIATIELDQYVDELSTLVHHLMDLSEPDACFLLARHESNIQIIARSTTDAIDVALIMSAFGGGGHSKAAAALAAKITLDSAVKKLLAELERRTAPPTRVREIMSTSVHTLQTDISVRDAAQLMRRYGHEGFPVVEGDRLVGILTRRDIDRALHHRLGDLPVRNFVHTGPLHVRPTDPVDAVQRVMLEHDLGQVPVVDAGRFVGIVTRTDLIKLWAPRPAPPSRRPMRELLEETVPPPLHALLMQARDVANDLGYSLYIVGGFVRDLILGSANLDLDLVVEGDAIAMARELAPKLGGRLRSHSRFGTAKIILDDERPIGVPPSLDFVTARTEFYERPTVLPQIEQSSIKQDLYRRDFTINTMALCLDRNRYGELLDFYGGERDLAAGRIRVLHNLSFVEDPTRILRAVRFEQRLDFQIEERTEELIDDALPLIDHVTGQRLRHEVFLLFREAEPEKALARLDHLGVLAHIHPDLSFTRDKATQFQRLRQELEGNSAHHNGEATLQLAEAPTGDEERPPTQSLCYLALLTSSMKPEELDNLTKRLRMSKEDTRFLRQVVHLRDSLAALQADLLLPSTLHKLLSPYSREALFVLQVLTRIPIVRERLRYYEEKLARVEPRVDGRYLKSVGLRPGPIYGEILGRLREALLDGQISTLEEEQELARHLAARAHRRNPAPQGGQEAN